MTPCLETILKNLLIGGKIPAKDMAEDVYFSIAASVHYVRQRGVCSTTIKIVNSFYQKLSSKLTFFTDRLREVCCTSSP